MNNAKTYRKSKTLVLSYANSTILTPDLADGDPRVSLGTLPGALTSHCMASAPYLLIFERVKALLCALHAPL